MSEEKQAIEKLQNVLWYYEPIKDIEENINIVLNLIRKQQDEIKELNQEIEDLHSQIDELMED